MPSTHRLAAIMFTDIVGYTRLMGTDEAKALEFLRINREIHKRLIKKYGGKYLKEMGDGCLASFPSASNAAFCAGDIQEHVKEYEGLNLKIGIHLGEVLEENGDIFGDGVNIAARIESSAKPGQILVSNSVQDNLINKDGITSILKGPLELKNVQRPIIIHEITIDRIPEIQELNINTEKEESTFQKYLRINGKLKIAIFSMLALLLLLFGTNTSFITNNILGIQTGSNFDLEDKLAVLHFENQTGDPELEVVGPMVSHWLTEGFIQNGDVKIVSANTIQRAYSAGGQEKNVAKIKSKLIKELGTNYIIDGSFFLQHDSIIIRANLIDVKSGDIIYAFGSFSGDKDEPVNIIENLREKVLGYWFNKDKIQRYPAPRFDAYKKYIQAQQYWGEDHTKVYQLLKESIKLDPDFNEPYFLQIAQDRNDRNWSSCDSTIQILDNKRSDLTKAQLEKLNFFKYELEGEYSAAYTHLLSEFNRDENDLFMNSSVVNFALFCLNDPQEAIRVADFIPIDSIEFENCHYCKYRLYLVAAAYFRLGKFEEALKVCTYNPRLNGDVRVYHIELLSYANLNMQEQIDSLLTKREMKSPDGYQLYYYNVLSNEYSLLGNQAANQALYKEIDNKFKNTKFSSTFDLEDYAFFTEKMGDFDKALEIYSDLSKKYPNDDFYKFRIAGVYMQTHQSDLAQKLLSQLESARQRFDFGSLDYELARISALSGDAEQSISYLKKALNAGLKYQIRYLENDWYLMSLWDNPEFKQLMDKRKLKQVN